VRADERRETLAAADIRADIDRGKLHPIFSGGIDFEPNYRLIDNSFNAPRPA